MERRTKRYCVMSVFNGEERYVDSFDLLDQARLCVLHMQQDFRFALRDKKINFPDLVIRDTRECSAEQPTGRKTGDKLRMMKRIDAENDRRTREWRKRHEAAPRA